MRTVQLREVVEKVIDNYCSVLGIRKPQLVYADSAFGVHKAETHGEDRDKVITDIRRTNSNEGRGLDLRPLFLCNPSTSTQGRAS